MVHDGRKSPVLEDVTNYSIEANCPTAVDGVAYREMKILVFTIEKDLTHQEAHHPITAQN
jgi:hypothetical protein